GRDHEVARSRISAGGGRVADPHDLAVRLDDERVEARCLVREGRRDAAPLTERGIQRAVGIEPADRALAPAKRPLAAADQDLPIRRERDAGIELAPGEGGDSLRAEGRVDAEVGVEPQGKTGKGAAPAGEAAGAAAADQEPLPVGLLEHRAETISNG